jgi:hypothetical protein
MKITTLLLAAFIALSAMAQQPQTQTAPLYPANAKYVQGAGPGYWPTPGSGLTLNLAAGRVRCSNTMTNYAGGTLTMANNTTNYIYLDTASSCVPASNTSGYTSAAIAIATVVTSSGVITTITDDRVFGIATPAGGVSGTVTSIATTSPITGGTITSTGTVACATCVTSASALTSNRVMAGAGSQASQVSDLTGDVTTSGSMATTVAKVDGVAYPSGPSTHQVPVVTATNTATYKTVPDCTDTSGNHINYTQSSDSFSCGNTGATSGTVTTTGSPASGNLTKFSGTSSITNGDLSGDCTTSSTLAITCTKTSGSSFAASATTDTTAAGNISSGTLPAGRLPALTGNVTSSAGSASTTIAAGVVTEAMQVLAVNTTNDVSTTKHGYAPQAPNDATRFLDGTGAYSVPAGGGSSGNGFAWGGDGSDSVLDFDGTNTFSGIATTTGSAPNFVYTLIRDAWATTLTVESGKTLKTAQFGIFATTSVTVNGTLRNNGLVGATTGSNAGGAGGANGETGTNGSYTQPTGQTTGIAGGAGFVAVTGAGSSGTVNNGVAGANTVCPTAFAPSTWNSGAGGTSGTVVNAGGSAAANGTPGTVTARTDQPRVAARAVMMLDNAGNTFQICNTGGGSRGGGAGGGDGTNKGGNGGGGGGQGGFGGFLVVAAPTITVGGSGVISANGGNGGAGSNGANGVAGNAGGGGGGAGGLGGNGGLVALIYHTLANSGTISANAGSGGGGGTHGNLAGSGANGTDGQSGPNGNAGFVFEMQN